jgi:hypothetical protein
MGILQSKVRTPNTYDLPTYVRYSYLYDKWLDSFVGVIKLIIKTMG